MPLEAADPARLLALDAVAAALVQPEYVYLFLVVRLLPMANMPTVALPAAEPALEEALDDVAAAFVSPE